MVDSIDTNVIASFLEAEGLLAGYRLDRLPQLVVLAGRNGSGKSRFLRAFHAALAHARGLRKEHVPPYGGDRARFMEAVTYQPSRRQFEMIFQQLDIANSLGFEVGEVPAVIDLSSRAAATIQDDRALSGNRRDQVVEACATESGFAAPYQGQHAFVAKVARDLFLKEHPAAAARADYEQLVEEAESFNELVRVLLGTYVSFELSSSSEVIPALFGRRYTEAELSSGQKILLAWAIALHAQRESLSDAIVIIDEPENHMHPDVCIRALETLRDEVLGTRGQIWVATHSIPLIAWAGAEGLHVVEEGRVTYRGNAVAAVIDSLSGGANGRDRLHGFLADADHFGFFHFVAQCLTPPEVAAAKAGDPQERSLEALVADRIAARGSIRVLDYGAGRARLADALARAATGRPELTKVHYFAYDPFEDHANERSSAIDRLKTAGAEASAIAELGSLRVSGREVDLVVMCNVLHEIPAEQWEETFRDLGKVLAPDGHLVIVEDQLPPVGELPHDKGFLVLGFHEVEELFGGHGAATNLSKFVDPKYRDRLTVFEVPAANVAKLTKDSRERALKMLRDRAKAEVTKLRAKKDQGQSDGRRHALSAMLWMSAKLALHED